MEIMKKIGTDFIQLVCMKNYHLIGLKKLSNQWLLVLKMGEKVLKKVKISACRNYQKKEHNSSSPVFIKKLLQKSCKKYVKKQCKIDCARKM